MTTSARNRATMQKLNPKHRRAMYDPRDNLILLRRSTEKARPTPSPCVVMSSPRYPLNLDWFVKHECAEGSRRRLTEIDERSKMPEGSKVWSVLLRATNSKPFHNF